MGYQLISSARNVTVPPLDNFCVPNCVEVSILSKKFAFHFISPGVLGVGDLEVIVYWKEYM